MKYWYTILIHKLWKHYANWLKETHKWPHITWFHLYEVSKTGKSVETEKLVVAWGWREREDGIDYYMVSFWGDESVLNLDCREFFGMWLHLNNIVLKQQQHTTHFLEWLK